MVKHSKLELIACELVHEAGLCGAWCSQHGGCLLRPYCMSPAEAKRHVFAAHALIVAVNCALQQELRTSQITPGKKWTPDSKQRARRARQELSLSRKGVRT